MRRRRRRPAGTWFPVPGIEANDNVLSAGQNISLTVPGNGTPVTSVIPLTFDEPTEGADVGLGTPLVSILGDEYFLRRIVGKVHAYIRSAASVAGDFDNFQGAILLTCGFFVARAGDFQDDNAVPIGGHLTRDYSPDQPNTIREPWIWRRSWVLSDPNLKVIASTLSADALSVAAAGALAFPTSTDGYGSVLDGPHIDAKTKRRVTSDDRLWFASDAKAFPVGTSGSTTLTSALRIHLDYRIFGSLRKARNRGVF